MRRNVARIGLVAALALSMGVATATAPPTRADDHTGLIAPARASAGLMNYAINLSPQASAEDLARATSLVAPLPTRSPDRSPGARTPRSPEASRGPSPEPSRVARLPCAVRVRPRLIRPRRSSTGVLRR